MPGSEQTLSRFLCNEGMTSRVTGGLCPESSEEEVVWGQEAFLACDPRPPPLRLLGGDKDRLDVTPSLGDSHHGCETRDLAQITGITQKGSLWAWTLPVDGGFAVVLKPHASDLHCLLPRSWKGSGRVFTNSHPPVKFAKLSIFCLFFSNI